MPKITGSRNFWLDACRSLAILMVLLSHGRHFLAPALPNTPVLRIGGFLGVELFFVLSGFLVGSIAWRKFKATPAGSPWARSFLVRRWLRTLPNYYLFLFVNAVLLAAAVVPGDPAVLLPFALFAQNLAWPHPPAFGEAWSLAVEEVFYLVFPLGLLLVGRVVSTKRTALLTATAVLVLVPLAFRCALVEFSDPAWDEGVRKVVLFRLDALMFGVLAGWLSQEHPLPNQVRGMPLIALGAAFLLPAIWFFLSLGKGIDASVFARVWLFTVVSVGFCCIILAGLHWSNVPGFLARGAEWFARWSYALYLAHMPVFHLIAWSFGPAAEGDGPGALARWTGFLVASVAVAALVERLFERPVLLWRDRVVPR